MGKDEKQTNNGAKEEKKKENRKINDFFISNVFLTDIGRQAVVMRIYKGVLYKMKK